jgi:hypothetical protein
MNPAIKKQWVEALRSGEYKQGREYLRQGDKFCCLGVLCDLYGKQHGVGWHGKTINYMLDETSSLPESVEKWAGVAGYSPEVVMNDKTVALATLNDGDAGFCHLEIEAIKPHTFLEIADIIEAQL